MLNLSPQLKVLLLKWGALALAAKRIYPFTLGGAHPTGQTPRRDAETPGRIKRFVIWVQGCPFNCMGCIAPDWIPQKAANIVAVQDLARQIIASDDLEGITISGGEPALQARGLARLIHDVKAVRPSLTAIAFSGFTLEQLQKKAVIDASVAEFLNHLDVLIDGLYVQDLNDGLGLRGSSNQRPRFLSDRYTAMKDRFESGPRQVEVHLLRNELLMVGVPTQKAFEAFQSVTREIKER